MKIATLLYADIRDDAPECCGMCDDLFATAPPQCLRFGNEKCVELYRDKRGIIRRCDECVAAEAAYRKSMEATK